MVLDLNLEIVVAVGGKDVSVKELLDIDEADLSNEFASQAARYAYFSVLTAHAEGDWQDAVRARKNEEAEAYVVNKNDPLLVPKGSRTVSDGLCDKYVTLDVGVEGARNSEAILEQRYKIMRAITVALYMRSSMLQSIGANLRHEQDMTGMHVDNPATALRDAISRRQV